MSLSLLQHVKGHSHQCNSSDNAVWSAVTVVNLQGIHACTQQSLINSGDSLHMHDS